MLYLSIFLLSMSSLSLEVLLTRYFLISQWSHLSFMVISIALLGYAASGRFSYRFTGNRVGRIFERGLNPLSLLLLIYSAVSVLAYFLLNLLPIDFFRILIDRRQVAYLVMSYLILAIPFFATGLAVSVAYSFWPESAPLIYLVNMGASAIGVLLPFLLIGIIGEGATLILTALLPLIGVFPRKASDSGRGPQLPGSRSLRSGRPERRLTLLGRLAPESVQPGRANPRYSWLARFLALLIASVTVSLFFVYKDSLSHFRVSQYKALSQLLRYPGTRLVRSVVSMRERVDTVESPYVRFAPGLSLKYGKAIGGKEAVVLNGDGILALYGKQRDTSISSLGDFPLYTLSFSGYIVADRRRGEEMGVQYNDTGKTNLTKGKVLLVEEGGGTAVVNALLWKALRIDVVTASKGFSRALSGWYGDYSNLTLYHENPRAFMARLLDEENMKYDVIQIEDWGSSIPGMSSGNEKPMFTIDAFIDCIRLLADDGLIIISRKLLLPPSDSLRLFLTALGALSRVQPHRQDNRQDIKEALGTHLVVMRNWDTYTMLISREAFRQEDISLLKTFAERMNFDFIYYPGMKRKEANRFNVYEEPFYYDDFQRFLTAFESGLHQVRRGKPSKLERLLADYYLDVSPQSDKRPFGNHFIRFSRIGEYFEATGGRPYRLLMSGEVVIIAVFLEALVVSLLILLIPGGGASRKSILLPIAYFFLVGSGFIFIEMAFIKIFTIVTGNPVVAFTLVLFLVMAFSALGGRLSERFNPGPASQFVWVSLLFLMLILCFFTFQRVIRLFLILPAFQRLLFSALLMIPVSFLMGFPFPTGIRYSVSSPGERSYLWSVNGVSSVLAAIFSEFAVLSAGIDTLILAAIVSYLLLLFIWLMIWTKLKGISIL